MDLKKSEKEIKGDTLYKIEIKCKKIKGLGNSNI